MGILSFRVLTALVVFMLPLITGIPAAPAQTGSEGPVAVQQGTGAEQAGGKPIISQATMCERVDGLTPIRQAVVFSVSVGQVCCFTTFEPVPQPALIYHRWYHGEDLSTQTRLRLYPPRWSTYSVIQLREADKGPWRVEVSDQNGHVFQVLRFSISD